MRVGIDIDGVITDIGRYILDYGTKFCCESGIKFELHPEEYDEWKMLEITEEQAEKFWNKYLTYYATKGKPRKCVSEVIQRLKEQGHEIYIITARNEEGLPPETYGTMQLMVKEWLAENDIIYDKLIFTNGSKLPYCLENNIDIMIEDSPYNLRDIATKVPVLCFDNSYNRDVNEKNITRVYSWYDILEKIK